MERERTKNCVMQIVRNQDKTQSYVGSQWFMYLSDSRELITDESYVRGQYLKMYLEKRSFKSCIILGLLSTSLSRPKRKQFYDLASGLRRHQTSHF